MTTGRARRDGLTDADIRALLADHGLAVAEIDLAWWWLPGAADVHIPAELDTEELFAYDEAELFRIADAVGARSINAIDVFGGDWTRRRRRGRVRRVCATAPPSTACSCTSSSCRGRASRTSRPRGRSCASPIGRTAECSSTRGTTSAAAPTTPRCARCPGDRVLGLQLDDGPAAPEADLPDRVAARAAAARAPASSTSAASCGRCARSARSRRSGSRCSPTSCTRSTRSRPAAGPGAAPEARCWPIIETCSKIAAMASRRFPFPTPFGWFQVAFPDDLAPGEVTAARVLEPRARAVARHGRRRSTSRTRSARTSARTSAYGGTVDGDELAVPVPRLALRRRRRVHEHPVQPAHEPQGEAAHVPDRRAQRLRARVVPPERRTRRSGRSR